MNILFKTLVISILFIASLACNNTSKNIKQAEDKVPTSTEKTLNKNLPNIGLLVYDGVLVTEVTASADVFTKGQEKDGKALFNVFTIGQTKDAIVSEEGLKIIPDFSFDNCPKLDVLFVPSAYDMTQQVANTELVNFIKTKNKETQYTVSNCAGAQLIGAAGIAKGKKIVTWIGGGKDLQKDYPELLVQDDEEVTFVEDGKFLSSNGNLTSYISALQLLEKMTNKEHRAYVESYIYLKRLQDWEVSEK